MAMTDKDFAELSLRSSLCPSLETQWEPPTSFQHWADLHAAANELRNVVGHVRAGVEAIEKDADLTADARKRKRHELARQTMEQLEKIKSVEKARQSVAAITAKYQAKIDSVLTRPEAEDAATATLFWELRDKFAQLKDERARISWIQRYGNDPLVPSALLHGPAGLTSLSEAERALLTNKVEALADPKLTEAKSKVTRALAELDRAFRAAPTIVAQCAGLNKAAAARPLPERKSPMSESPTSESPMLAAPKATPPTAGGPNWPNTNSGSPPTAGKPNWA